MQLILASTSPYRAGLLGQLHLPFVQMDPMYTETRLPGEPATALARRLALGKAASLAGQAPAAPYLIIASDQVATLASGTILGKPGQFHAAFDQLKAASGQWMSFETAICLLDDHERRDIRSEVFAVKFRDLTDKDITRYLNLEQPYDSAGSVKLESAGISLIEDTRGRDLTTALGLPLMLLVEMLQGFGIDVLNEMR